MNLFKSAAVVCVTFVAVCGCGEGSPTANFQMKSDADEEMKRTALVEAAKLGDVEAMHDLALSYYRDEDLVNKVDAALWFKKAAESGHADAQNFLGGMYEEGKGVVQDYAKAAEYYRLSAEQGNDAARNNLGVCYLRGIGVEKNLVEAYGWISIGEISENLDGIKDDLTIEEIKQGQKRAAELLEKYGRNVF